MSKIATDLSCVTTVSVDLAKHVFQVHAVDASGKVIVTQALRRRDLLPFFASLPPCLVGMEACGSAHHWGRELIALGHDVKLIPGITVTGATTPNSERCIDFLSNPIGNSRPRAKIQRV